MHQVLPVDDPQGEGGGERLQVGNGIIMVLVTLVESVSLNTLNRKSRFYLAIRVALAMFHAMQLTRLQLDGMSDCSATCSVTV